MTYGVERNYVEFMASDGTREMVAMDQIKTVYNCDPTTAPAPRSFGEKVRWVIIA